ncbi:MAG TPA: hypothetical protein ENI66_01380, partial [Candidatus Yonathbacteria bacterium]|nr:hypothetical protein [Candidatus Yonathbacteria bacterium]
MIVKDEQLKEFLTDAGLVSQKIIGDADKKAKKKGRTVGEMLVSNGELSEDDLRRSQAYILGIPF